MNDLEARHHDDLDIQGERPIIDVPDVAIDSGVDATGFRLETVANSASGAPHHFCTCHRIACRPVDGTATRNARGKPGS